MTLLVKTCPKCDRVGKCLDCCCVNNMHRAENKICIQCGHKGLNPGWDYMVSLSKSH